MKLRIFTGAWSDYVDTLENACAASLGWPRNRAAIQGANWDIVTEESNFERVNKLRESLGIEGRNWPLIEGKHPTLQFSDYLYAEMQTCIDQDATFLFALPDYVFGDGTIPNLKACMIEKGLCLAVPNTRVLPQTMDLFKQPRTNAELVTIAFDPQYIHQTWKDAEFGKPTSDTFYGGVLWQEIEPGLITVMHRLPSSYMCSFLQSDIDFFKKQLSFSAWDHVWGASLVEAGRQRFIGSSDVAFITEITEADRNCAPVTKVSPKSPSDFFRNLLHNKINRNVTTVFKKG